MEAFWSPQVCILKGVERCKNMCILENCKKSLTLIKTACGKGFYSLWHEMYNTQGHTRSYTNISVRRRGRLF